VNHLIHRVSVELGAQNRVAALVAQEATSHALQDDLPVVGAVFDTRFPEKRTHRLDRLEIDLGPLPLRGFRQAFIASLAKALTAIDAKGIPPGPGVRIVESPRSTQCNAQPAAGSKDAVEAFLHYIVHGSLPWFFPLERWREEIPKVLMTGEAFSALCSRLPPAISEDPARLLRLLPFTDLVRALFTSEFRVAEESVANSVAGASLPTRPFGTRIQLALWFLRFNPEPDAKVETTLVRLLAVGRRGVLAIELNDFQPVMSALAAARMALKSPEVVLLSKLITRARRRVADFQPRERIEFATSEGPSVAQDLAENGIPTESAGIVLLHPFLIRFFQLFGWLGDRLRILHERRWHAVHAMRWIAHKHPARDDVDLVLEKALCGIPLGEVACWPELEYRIKEEADSLLRAVIGHWKALKDTSPDGLREAFLARPGLFYAVEPPRLHIETRAYDMLLSRLPWSFDRVALPWLRSPIEVRWSKPA
jgi:Contractile injection system tape measure protein